MTIGRVVLVFIDLDAFSVQALAGQSLRLLSIAEDIVLPYLLIVKFCCRPGSTALSADILPDIFRTPIRL
jgi:hypothetical protein